jgi:hypothetical protein
MVDRIFRGATWRCAVETIETPDQPETAEMLNTNRGITPGDLIIRPGYFRRTEQRQQGHRVLTV